MSKTPAEMADFMEKMVAAGAPIEAIIVAVREMDASANVRFASKDNMRTWLDRRKRDRDRQREKRAKLRALKDAAKANDVAASTTPSTDASTDTTDNRCDLSSLLADPRGIQEVREKKAASVVEGSNRGTRLSPDWRPSEADWQFATDHNVDPENLLPEFLDYWTAVPGWRGVKLDWSKTWRNRVRRVASYRKEKPNGKAQSPIMAACDNIIDYFEQQRDSGEGQAAAGLLPDRRRE